jgi:hypothetical protein
VRLTPWFCAMTHPPVRVGWYLCRNAPTPEDPACAARRYWNGSQWSAVARQHDRGPRMPRGAIVGFGDWTTANQWRGLTAEGKR